MCVLHLSGRPFSFLVVLSSEIGRPDYFYVNTCHIVHKYIRMQTSDSFPCKPEMAYFLVIFIIQMTHLDEFNE